MLNKQFDNIGGGYKYRILYPFQNPSLSIGSTINLNDSISNYDVLVFRCGSNTDGTVSGGVYNIFALTNNTQYGCTFDLNGVSRTIILDKVSETQFRVSGLSNTGQSNLRAIYGIRFSR